MADLDQLYVKIAALIRARREDAGLTQEELAARIGLTRGSVTNLEQARQRVQLDRLVEIAEALGVPLRDLLPVEEAGERLDLPREQLRRLPTPVQTWVQEMMVAPPGGGPGAAGLEKLERLRADKSWRDMGLANMAINAQHLSGATGLPVPVERVAQGLGIQVKYGPTNASVAVTLYQANTVAMIAVNSLMSANRQRFAVAHALGHALLHDHVFYAEAGFPEAAGEEAEANAFAAELLVPGDELLRELGGKTLDFEDDEAVRALAERYKVSQRVMSLRLMDVWKGSPTGP